MSIIKKTKNYTEVTITTKELLKLLKLKGVVSWASYDSGIVTDKESTITLEIEYFGEE